MKFKSLNKFVSLLFLCISFNILQAEEKIDIWNKEIKEKSEKTIINDNQIKENSNSKVLKIPKLENDIKIEVLLANSQSIGIDTKEDFVKVKKILETKN